MGGERTRRGGITVISLQYLKEKVAFIYRADGPHLSRGASRNLAPHVAQQRQRGYVLWHHADGEVSMAQPLGKHAAALAFAGMWRIDEAEAAARLQALKALNQRIAQQAWQP